jgi:hypothetical protein
MTGTPKKGVIRGFVGNQMPCATLYAHFIRISWWGVERKYTSSKKDPGENNGTFLAFRQIMNAYFTRRLCSLFSRSPRLRSRVRDRKKNSASRLEGQRKFKQILEVERFKTAPPQTKEAKT